MDKLKMHSPDLTQANIAKLRELFPGCVTEAAGADGALRLAVDFDQLRQELSAQVVDGAQERYGLGWPGKRAAMLNANAPIAKTLRPARKESVEFAKTKNLFIEGDNLDVLRLIQEAYLAKVKMIYIDPPYNTGRDFIYRDDFREDSEDFRIKAGDVDPEGNRFVQNTTSNGRFHSDWLSMMYSRLRIARNLLAPDGVIFISIDDCEVNNLSLLCDEVFGSGNRVGTLVWKSKSGGANDSGALAVDHEYVLCYSKEQVNEVLGLDPDAVATTNYNHEDEIGRYSLERLDKQNLQYSPAMDYVLVGPDGTEYTLDHRDPTRPNAIWRWSRDKVAANLEKLVFRDGNVYTKNYEKAGGKPRSLLVDERYGRTRTGSTEVRDILGGDFFDNPKPTKLLKTLVAIGSRKDSIVLDFFAGSGTTAHAVMEQNAMDGGQRRFIAVQLDESVPAGSSAGQEGFRTIGDITKERLRRAGALIRATSMSVDIGFRVFGVDTANFADVYYAPDALKKDSLDLFVDNVKPDRSAEDLLFQVMLDWGVDLALPIENQSIQGKDVFLVDGNALVACFDASGGVDEPFVKELAKLKPLRVVFRDAGFKADDVKTNVEQVFKLLSPSTDVRTI